MAGMVEAARVDLLGNGIWDITSHSGLELWRILITGDNLKVTGIMKSREKPISIS